jgi:hypothetical protein
MLIVYGLEHITDVLLDDLAFVWSEFDVSVLFFCSGVVGVSEDHSNKCFSFLNFNSGKELVSRSELFFEELLFLAVFFDQFKVFESIVLLEQIGLNEFSPDVFEIIVVSSVSEINDIGSKTINYGEANAQAK